MKNQKYRSSRHRVVKNMPLSALNTRIIVEEATHEVDEFGGLITDWRKISRHWGKVITTQNTNKIVGNKIHFAAKQTVILTKQSTKNLLQKINKIRLVIENQAKILQITGVNLSDDFYTILTTSELM